MQSGEVSAEFVVQIVVLVVFIAIPLFNLAWNWNKHNRQIKNLEQEVKSLKRVVGRQACYLAWLRHKDFIPSRTQMNFRAHDYDERCDDRDCLDEHECPVALGRR